MSDSVDRVFVHALNTVKRIPRTGSARPPDSDRLKLYGLYKQSTEGDVEGIVERPQARSLNASDGISEADKWESWHSNAGMPRTEAKRQYITTLIETMHRYATTTPEARELVAELEFVWDQIKSNSASPSDSLHEQAGQFRDLQDSPLLAKSGQRSRTDVHGLKILRPLSDEVDGPEDEEDVTKEYGDEAVFGRGEMINRMAAGYTPQDNDTRNQNWKKRVEQALVKMTVEVAALREQMESSSSSTRTRRTGIGAWLAWITWTATRHLLIDATLLCLAVIWARRRGDPTVDHGLQLLMSWIREQSKSIRLPLIRPRAKG